MQGPLHTLIINSAPNLVLGDSGDTNDSHLVEPGEGHCLVGEDCSHSSVVSISWGTHRTRPGPALRGHSQLGRCRKWLHASFLWSQSGEGDRLYPVGMGSVGMILSRK